jgi:hypothetical protein
MALIEIVEIRLGAKRDGSIDRDAPFLVLAKDDDRCAFYANEPAVLGQFAEHEETARFEAIWDGNEWQFGRRVWDA